MIIIETNRNCSNGGNSQRLCNSKCDVCWNKSFASSDKSAGWSENNLITAREVFKLTNAKHKFICGICNHEYITAPFYVVKSPTNGCPYCSHNKLCLNDNCELCYNNSFASSNNMDLWWYGNNVDTRTIFKSASVKYWFQCNTCKHLFESRLSHMSAGHGCPYCENMILCSNLGCSKCFYKSLLSSEKSIYWAKENKKTPRDVFMASRIKYIFNCILCGKKYKTSPEHISRGQWCPCTKMKTETKLNKWLLDNGFDVIDQGEFEWCRGPESNRKLRFDFVIESLKIIIELDGLQHFEKVTQWKSSEKDVRKRDIYKMKNAIDNGYTVIRLLQTDVWNNKNNWEYKLKRCINACVSENKAKKHMNIPNIKQYYFLCENQEYLDHDLLLNFALLKNTIQK